MSLYVWPVFMICSLLNIGGKEVESNYIVGEVVYDYYIDKQAVQERLLNLKTSNPEIYEQVGEEHRRPHRFSDDIQCSLTFGSSTSLFQLKDRKVVSPEDELEYESALILTKSDRSYYLDNEEKVRMYTAEINMSPVNVILDYERYDWKLLKEEKVVRGRVLYKAVTEVVQENFAGKFTTNVEAWYAPDIPVPFGPVGFDGLPGLIMELRFGDKALTGYSAVSVDVKMVRGIVSIPKPKATGDLLYEDYMEKLLGSMPEGGVVA